MTRRIKKGRIQKTIAWWWRLPRWVKSLKILLILLGIFGSPALDRFEEWRAYHTIYHQYYQHYYDIFIAKKPERNRDYYENYYAYYADYYAKYYSSKAFRDTMRDALPSADNETISYPKDSILSTHTTTRTGLTLIQAFEGLRLAPYADAGGRLTIGYGHLLKPGEYYTHLSEKEAQRLLQKDVRVAEAYVKRYVKTPLRPAQFSALVSLVYNVGPGNFARSTLLDSLNHGHMDDAADEFLRWDHVGEDRLEGLTRRREAEKRLFES